MEVVVVQVDSQVVCSAMGLEAKDAWLSLATVKRLEAGWAEDEVEKVAEKLTGVLGFSLSHVGPSLEELWEGGFVLVLAEVGTGLDLEAGVFVGKSLRGSVLLGNNDLRDRKHKI